MNDEVRKAVERTAYLVYGFDNYEYPCRPIKAFASEAGANALLAEIVAHQEKKPAYPSDNASDEEYDVWDAQFSQWRESHPACHAYGHDDFGVMLLTFVEVNQWLTT